jgi:hypothetical protein
VKVPQTQNVDQVYFLQPTLTILFSVALVVYWRYRREFTSAVLLYSLLAYAGAIAIKAVLQAATFNAFEARYGGNAAALGLYFGVQTVGLEIGGAFLVAAWAVSRRKLQAKDAEGYGLSLALWENAGLLGVLGLVSLVTVYMTLSSGSPSAQEFYASLVGNRPDLFYSPTQALPLIAWGVLERVTSLLFHFSWGYLCLLAACFHRRNYLLLALPMGLVDFFVPFVGSLTLPVFESFLFVLGLGCLGLTLLVGRGSRSSSRRRR